MIRVTSKPPCVVVWLAFLAGIKGLQRYQICRGLEEKLKELTITQKVCWRDLPGERIKPIEVHFYSHSRTSILSFSQSRLSISNC